MNFATILDFVAWIGSSAGVVALLSFINERWAWFQNLTSKQRQLISIVIAILLPEMALILTEVVPSTTWDVLNPHFQAILVGLGALTTILASELAHSADKRFFIEKK